MAAMPPQFQLNRRQLLQAGGIAILAPAVAARPYSLASAAPGAGTLPPPPLTRGSLWYARPAVDWESQALPLGNGRLGAMFFGGVDHDVIQFAEESLWGGVNDYDNALAGQPDDAFDTSVTGFGSYQGFGTVEVDFGAPAGDLVTVSSPTGNSAGIGDGSGLERSIDGRDDTAWHTSYTNRRTVSWQAEHAAPVTVTGYRIASSGHRPDTDPTRWVLEGSVDGLDWHELDAREGIAFDRGQIRTFEVAVATSDVHHRITFGRGPSSSQLTIGQITLFGKEFDTSNARAVVDYQRNLDTPSGTHVTYFRDGERIVLREAFSGTQADVLAVRYRTTPNAPVGRRASPGAKLGGTVALRCAHDSPTTVTEGDTGLSFSGRLANDLSFASALHVSGDGEITAEADRIRFDDCTELVLLLDARRLRDVGCPALARCRTGAGGQHRPGPGGDPDLRRAARRAPRAVDGPTVPGAGALGRLRTGSPPVAHRCAPAPLRRRPVRPRAGAVAVQPWPAPARRRLPTRRTSRQPARGVEPEQ